MIYVKVAITTYNNRDVQYVEVEEGTKGAIAATTLTSEVPWAIYMPSEECVTLVSECLSGCKVQTYNNVRYLMSPKALQYYPTTDLYSDVVILTFHMPHQLGENCHFLMVNMSNKNFWHNLWVPRFKDEVSSNQDKLLQEMREGLGLIKTESDLKRVGSWKFFRKYHRVINLRTFLCFNAFHCHLSYQEVKQVLRFCHVPIKLQKTSLTQVFECPNNNKYSYLMVMSRKLLPRMPTIIQQVVFDETHREALSHLLGYPCGTHVLGRCRQLVSIDPLVWE
jgi:hypothetical protein